MMPALALWLACAGAAFVGETPQQAVQSGLTRQQRAAYKLAWRECEAKVREADANKVEGGHCVEVRKPRKMEAWR
jgi:hypothetical protein